MSRSHHRPRRQPPLYQTVAGLAVLLVGGQLLACATAGVAKESAPPRDAVMDLDHATVDEAEAVFEAAEEDLQGLMVTSVDESQEGQELLSHDDDDDGAVPARVPAPAPAQQQRRHASSSKASRCERACRALGSMQRSADRLCDLTGKDDDRCRSVRVRVESAEGLVRRFCPACQP